MIAAAQSIQKSQKMKKMLEVSKCLLVIVNVAGGKDVSRVMNCICLSVYVHCKRKRIELSIPVM